MIGQRIPVRWKEKPITTSRAHDVAVMLNAFTILICLSLAVIAFAKTYELSQRVEQIERLNGRPQAAAEQATERR
jgi:hypothetical protein